MFILTLPKKQVGSKMNGTVFAKVNGKVWYSALQNKVVSDPKRRKCGPIYKEPHFEISLIDCNVVFRDNMSTAERALAEYIEEHFRKQEKTKLHSFFSAVCFSDDYDLTVNGKTCFVGKGNALPIKLRRHADVTLKLRFYKDYDGIVRYTFYGIELHDSQMRLTA